MHFCFILSLLPSNLINKLSFACAMCFSDFNQFSGMTLPPACNLWLMETLELLFLHFVGHRGYLQIVA